MALSQFDVVNAITTGAPPVEFFGVCGGREDLSFDQGWHGCIDATDYVPTGKLHVNREEFCIVPVCTLR